MKRTLLIGLTAILGLGSLKAQNCITYFNYQTPLLIHNPNTDTLFNHQVKINFDSQTLINAGKMQADGDDIRFAGSCCDIYCHYLQDSINTNNTVVWVRVPMILPNDTVEIMMVYGNDTISGASDGECTFDFYEPFDSTNYKFTANCGNTTANVNSGNLDLSWTSQGVLISDSIFDVNTVYTGEMQVGAATGTWPAIYWRKVSDQRGYSTMINTSQVRIAEAGTSTGFCQGSNWASTLISYSSVVGLWQITWVGNGQQEALFPSVGAISATSTTHNKDADLRLCIGGISSGSGSLQIDWIRARKYAANTPVYAFGTEDTITVTPLSLGNDTTICSNDTLVLDAGSYSTYSWSTGATTQTINADTAGAYVVMVTGNYNCTFEDTINISEYPAPIVSLGADTTICNGDSISFDAGTGFVSYLWSDNSTTQSVTFTPADNDTSMYSVMVTDSNGCSEVDEITVITVECVGINELGKEVTVTYFPNPTTGVVNYSLNGFIGEVEVNVYSQVGKAVRKQLINTNDRYTGSINLDGLSKGVYLIEVKNDSYRNTQQIFLK